MPDRNRPNGHADGDRADGNTDAASCLAADVDIAGSSFEARTCAVAEPGYCLR